MAADRTDRVSVEAPGADEVDIVPWPLLFRQRVAGRVAASDRERWWILWTVLTGLFSVGVTITILAVSLPLIADDLNSTPETLTWLITGPLLAFGVVGPVLGKAGDVWGYRKVYLLGLGGSIVFAALSVFAWNATSLIAFRVLGVAEGAATGPASMAMIMRAFPEDDRVKAMGFWSLIGAGAPVLGVVIGGPIVEHVSWRLIFAAQVPLSLAAVALAALVLPSDEGTNPHERRPIDIPGVLTLSGGVTALLFALNRGPVWGWSHTGVVFSLVISPMLLGAFIAVERATDAPLIPLAYFRRRNFTFPIGVQFFSNFAYMGSFILTPFFLKEAFDYGETHIGLVSIARPLTFSLTAPLAGYLAVRLGERTAGIAGVTAVIASTVVWTTVSPGAGDLHIMAALALAGVGLGVSSPSMAASVANAVDEHSLGIAGAAQQLITQVGIVAGIQVAETFQTARETSAGLVASYHQAYVLLGGVCLLGLACAAAVRNAERATRASTP